ncbi:MAG: hypothetical protein A2268_08225 [Candidatus Raymondbacteria bacterium RifOxyA12_full_50_37]|nr:MAG: hypothetical protein A2268_08225 [Candidatus Raymondbacteria bacterium RifOxyA12_full_50_37]OGJ93489.1 MAG: hypothetical protein A2248_08935 [Candidatus Raymondbacteria bacterium RIFOXYA2_FULL_49_16]OGP45608.1 MAG: hypothetical protein A2324_04535 [Candidatus Raymondbacteria bacterium RIFOXYB2_FULL_49_35]
MDNNQEKREALLTTIMNRFSEVFREKAVLRGGMVLRLLECPRLTNDLDYVFVPFKSKNDIKDSVVSTLREIPGINLTYSLNSKCLRIVITSGSIKVQVEVTVDKQCKTAVLTSAPLSKRYNQAVRTVQVMDLSVALSNKLSAWLDRRLMRDIYDIQFFLNMGVRPDLEILEKRLKKPVYARGVEPFPGKPPIPVQSFYDFLKAETLKLNEKQVSESLADILPEMELTGLAMRIKAAITSKLV